MDTTFIRVFGAAAVARCLPATGNHTTGKTCSLYEDATLVGRVPRKFSCVFLLFLRRGGRITPQVTGSRLQSSDLLQGGLGLPCVYVLEGEGKLIEKAKEILRFYFRDLPIFREIRENKVPRKFQPLW